VSQTTFDSADALPPSLDHLDGLLAGPAHAMLLDEGARVSVLLRDSWRSLPLLAGLEDVGVAAEVVTTSDGDLVVRTAVLPELRPVAERWTSGAVKRPPAGFALDGARLWWWCASAGSRDRTGYVLTLGPHDEEAWPALGAALSTTGLPAVFLPESGGGPAYKVVGAKRLRRLAELVGPAPAGTPDGAWPTP
jgi:hypothetical protein